MVKKRGKRGGFYTRMFGVEVIEWIEAFEV